VEQEMTFASISAPYHAHALATKYGQHFFTMSKLENLVKLGATGDGNRRLFLVGAYIRSGNHHKAIAIYNRLANGFDHTIITLAGSDILQMKRASKKNLSNLIKFFNRKDVHLAAVGDSLAKEANQLFRLRPEIIYMPLNHDFSEKIHPMPKKFSVGCYMPANGSTFYGYDVIVGAAKKMPDVKFYFYGLKGYTPTKRELRIKNIVWLRQAIKPNRMEDFLKDISCGIRVTDHDGNPMSLAEYNIAGRWFAYNKKMPYCEHIERRTIESVVKALRNIEKKSDKVNSGREFYIKRHGRRVFVNHVNKIYSKMTAA